MQLEAAECVLWLLGGSGDVSAGPDGGVGRGWTGMR